MKSRPITPLTKTPLNQPSVLLVLLFAFTLLSGCASQDARTLPEEQYYEQARQAMNSGNFEAEIGRAHV